MRDPIDIRNVLGCPDCGGYLPPATVGIRTLDCRCPVRNATDARLCVRKPQNRADDDRKVVE